MPAEVLARSPHAAVILQAGESPHCGLVYERYPRLLNDRLELEAGARLRWLRRFEALARETPVRAQRLETVHARLDAIGRDLPLLKRQATTRSRLACGLGNASATDVGLAFDAACGVPVLPGSSVKGLARAGAGLVEAPPSEVEQLLGRDSDTGDHTAGALAFLDALPLRWPRLEIDVITRHHDPEALPTQKTPLDADKPNPVHFLTVAPATTFVFRILPLGDADLEGAAKTASSWLVKALDDLGAGAKTAVGYGWMSAVD